MGKFAPNFYQLLIDVYLPCNDCREMKNLEYTVYCFDTEYQPLLTAKAVHRTPSHFTTWNGPLNRKTFGEVKPFVQ